MEIKQGGQTESLQDQKIRDIRFYAECGSVNLMLNGSSLSYLSFEEAIQIKRELDEAIKTALFAEIY